MVLRWFVATLHLAALPLGLAAIWLRGSALRGSLDSGSWKRALAADNAWGASALLWIGTGVWRAFGGLEKGTAYYIAQPVFHAKLGLVALILLLEVWPMATLVRARIALKRGEPIDPAPARVIAAISRVQAALVVLTMCAATALARGTFGR
ncbi:MAG TPA: DUF2214 family protein [Candidatus Sulfotelmatobacter sp.]|jgi:putative membrane protein|nr:DUF2214 family protein [Candidatus Sulfotelmatobacter sp.]